MLFIVGCAGITSVLQAYEYIAFLPEEIRSMRSLSERSSRANFHAAIAGELQFSLGEGAPEGASINAATGEFTWTPTEAQGPKAYLITVIVADGKLTDSEELVVGVDEVNQPPIFTSGPVTSAVDGEAYSYQLTGADADLPANTFTFKILDIPSWLSFDAATAILSGTPVEATGESTQVRLQVSDGKETSIQEFTLTVELPTGIFDRGKQEDNSILAYPNLRIVI